MTADAPNPDWSEIEYFFQNNAADRRFFLEVASGRVVIESIGAVGQVAREPGRYVAISPAPPRVQYRWMEAFVASVADPALRATLVQAMDGQRAFRRFKDVLQACPGEYDRWHDFRTRALRVYILEWFRRHGASLSFAPPWADDGAACEVAAEATVRPDDPAAQTRLRALRLVDRLPAFDLPAAVAYLRYLSERATSGDAR